MGNEPSISTTSKSKTSKTTKKKGTGTTSKFTIPPDWVARCMDDKDWCVWFIHNAVKNHLKLSSASKKKMIDEDRLKEIKKECQGEDGDEDYNDCIEEKKDLEYYGGPAERSGVGGNAGLSTPVTIAIVAVIILVAIGAIIGIYCFCFGSRSRGGGRKTTGKSGKKSSKSTKSGIGKSKIGSKKSKSAKSGIGKSKIGSKKSTKSSKVGSKKSKKSIKGHKSSKKSTKSKH